jgi:L-ascorbate metabolism protein UlaG (beta-lactamase superfamily)
MSIKLTWYGHATWMISTGEHSILLDPFFNESPTAPIKSDAVDADFILVSHGHFDHVADVATIANKNDSTVIAIYEIAQWFGKNHSVKNTIEMNIGGTVQLPFGSVKMTPALHSSQLPDGSYAGCPAGFVVTINEKKLYFACDTGLFSDMQLIGDMAIDVAILPIGDLFTMGPADSLLATNFVRPTQVLPTHYNTWPPIEQDANKWAELIRSGSSAEPIVLQPGESHEC